MAENYQALLITGPNTGGKTVSLKTAGLLSAMTMCGLLIPVGDGSSISVFDHILVDIGDSQSIEQNLSTFSAHTNKVIEIIKTADSKSLVLLDELGSGTDPIEGAALAIAVIKRLMNSGAKIMVTTHYQELKVFAINSENVENASCEFDIETLRPTYRLIVGSPGKSNAFAISENLGMPSDIISEAKITGQRDKILGLKMLSANLMKLALNSNTKKKRSLVSKIKLRNMKPLLEKNERKLKIPKKMNSKRLGFVP